MCPLLGGVCAVRMALVYVFNIAPRHESMVLICYSGATLPDANVAWRWLRNVPEHEVSDVSIFVSVNC